MAKNKKSSEENPCWDGYEMLGTKKKDGKEVPNCVKMKSVKEFVEEKQQEKKLSGKKSKIIVNPTSEDLEKDEKDD